MRFEEVTSVSTEPTLEGEGDMASGVTSNCSRKGQKLSLAWRWPVLRRGTIEVDVN